MKGSHVVSGPDGVTNTGVAFLKERAIWQENLSFSCGGDSINMDRGAAARAAGLTSRMIIPVALNGEVLAVLNFYSKEAAPDILMDPKPQPPRCEMPTLTPNPDSKEARSPDERMLEHFQGYSAQLLAAGLSEDTVPMLEASGGGALRATP